MSDLKYDKKDSVAVLTLNRPDRLNAISGPMLDDLSKRLVEADQDREVRAIVITGEGRGFCAGLDLKDQMSGEGLSGGGGLGPPGELDLRQAPPTVLHNLDTPTIAAVNGGAAGYGMDLALGCDIRIAAESAKMAPAFVRRGILPESGGSWLLPRLIGYAKAAEICFLGETLSAKACLDLGLVNHMVPDAELMETAMDMAHKIAANAPLAVRATKRMLRMASEEDFDAHVQRVYLQLLPLFGTKDFIEGVSSFLERRAPQFEGR